MSIKKIVITDHAIERLRTRKQKERNTKKCEGFFKWILNSINRKRFRDWRQSTIRRIGTFVYEWFDNKNKIIWSNEGWILTVLTYVCIEWQKQIKKGVFIK